MTNANENVLVTGGAGYIGSHMVRDLGEQGFLPLVLDNLSTGNREHVLYGEFIEGDVGDARLVKGIIEKYAVKSVIHFAAAIEVEESVKNPFKYYKNNSVNSFWLLKTCVENGIENFIFSSTAAVYGIPRKIPTPEETALNPINPYGRSKMLTELLLEDVGAAYPSFRYIALRYFNVAGADSKTRIGQKYKNPPHLITRTLKTALGQYEELKIFGSDYDTPDGSAVRDYIHVDDLSAAHLLALEYLQSEKKSAVLNCGYGQGYSVSEVVESAKRVTGIDFATRKSARRQGDPPMVVADSGKIKRMLGWQPRHNNLDYIIKTAWEWEKRLNRMEQG